ncbi:hypothetical protein HY837_07005 [archaeon]|nr:hypothetical protein [archaeon]
MTEKSIKDFLYDTIGYARIEDFVTGEKDPDTTLRNFLNGTILGTFGKRSSPAIDSYDKYGKAIPAWKKNYITIPRIYSVSELEAQINEGKRYLNRLTGEDILKPEIQKRQFFLSSFKVFVGYTSKSVREKVQKIHQEGFPQAEYQFQIKGRFRGHIKQDDFYLFTEGSTSTMGAKLIVAAFNLPEEVVTDLNGISARYHYLMKNIDNTSVPVSS